MGYPSNSFPKWTRGTSHLKFQKGLTVNIEIFAWGIFRVFRDMAFAKIPPREIKTHNALLRKKVKYRENNPHMKEVANIFAQFSHQRK